MSLPPPILYDHARHASLLPSFARIHAACVQTDYTLATFINLAPDHDGVDQRILQYWEARGAQVAAGTRFIVMQMLPSSKDKTGALAGFVSLDMGIASETGPFRAAVEKLLVDPNCRRQGIATRLMKKLEEVAKQKEMTMLLLDTEVGSPAESVYPRLGYTVIGVIPKFGISPKDGRLVDEVFFYKDLNDRKAH